tara:strand:+ start:3568 stop:4809 length:1242 start_codon:yes stop_codon:yes gene_type:complete
MIEQKSERMKRNILFLQGPITPFFKLIADNLAAQGCACFRINLCFGDWLFWRGRDSTQFRGSQNQWPAFIEQYLDQHDITDIVLLGEQRFYHQQAIRLANERGIQVVTTDFGYLRPDWITFERNGMSANSDFPRQPERIMAIAENLPEPDLQQQFNDSFIRQVFWDMQYHLLSTALRWLYPGYRSHQLHHPIWVYLGTGFRFVNLRLFRQYQASQIIKKLVKANTRYMVFPLQMANDFQIRAYSDYDDLEQAIEEVIASFAAYAPQDMNLIIKLHPLDPGLTSWRSICHKLATSYKLTGRIHFIDGGSLDLLIEHCEGVVTINSTVGIWSLRQNKPTMALGQAVYKIKGLTHEGTLDRFWHSPSKPDKALCRAFFKALASILHIRGVYYHQPGLSVAVEEAARRLIENKINQP